MSVKNTNVATNKLLQTNLQVINSNEEVDLCMTEESLQAIASDLAGCPDPETLDLLRECWSARAMNAACKRLSPQKHDQIKQWVLALNAKDAEPAQTQLLDLSQPKQASTQVHQSIDSHQYRVHSTYLGETFEPCLPLKKDASTLLFKYIPTGQEILIHHTRPQSSDRWEKILNE